MGDVIASFPVARSGGLRQVQPAPCACLLDPDVYLLEGAGDGQGGVAPDDVLVEVVGSDERKFGAGCSEVPFQRQCVQEPER